MSWAVLKFGGSSVSTRARWDTIAGIVGGHRAAERRVLVVVSALSGVTDLLTRLLPAALRGEHGGLLDTIVSRHSALLSDLDLDPGLLDGEIDTLRRLATAVHLSGEASLRMTARVLGTGETLSSRLGAAFLDRRFPGTRCIDAREHLVALPAPSEHRRYLDAAVGHEPDAALAAALQCDLAVTQGFVARDREGHAVVLGRGGSDTSAAIFAARLGAERLEIWSDVPGMYSADPRIVPGARLLDEVDYAEAQELASLGAKVLHPRAVVPARARGTAIHLRSTLDPAAPGTIIRAVPPRGPVVRAVTSREGVLLVSMDDPGMGQEVGFLARVFAVFAAHGISVDHVATSETSVTCSVDVAGNGLDADKQAALVAELSSHCRVETVGPCAVVSIVGRQVRGVLPRLGPVLEAFESQPVHLVTQAASDLDLSFVVDQAQAVGLVRKLHALLFEDGASAAPPPSAPSSAWWVRRREELLALPGTPLYVYDAPTIRAAASAIASLPSISRGWYACKANGNPQVIALAAACGLGIECVSAGELRRAREAAPDAPLLFTPNFAPRAEYALGFDLGAQVTVDNPAILAAWPEVFAGRSILLRVDPGHGRGHHKHVRTGGAAAKFGIALEDLEAAARACTRAGAVVTGLHAHVGSGLLDPGDWSLTAARLASLLGLFPGARVLDLGGGLGVGDRPGDPGVDLAALDAGLSRFAAAHPGLELWLEPGRYVVARGGVLLATVTQRKRKGARELVGLDAGMNALLRPALYGAWHEVLNLSRLDAPADTPMDVVGPICESADVLGTARLLPASTAEGDRVLVAHAGAYGHAMASSYNLRAPPEEVMLW